MRTQIVYDSKFGNTEMIAKAIADGASASSEVDLQDLASGVDWLGRRPDLLLIGGPTQRRTMSPALAAGLDSAGSGALAGVSVATFDTRYRGSTLIMGSAAAAAAKRLGKIGAALVAAPQSFFIGRGGPLERQTLEAGEIDRAEAWGRDLASRLADRIGVRT
jgi:flavodoxin